MATEDDPGITKRQKTRDVKKAAENAAGLTTAEKLTRASKEETANVPITYSGGDFDIEVQLAMVSERQAIQNLSRTFKRLSKSVAGDLTKQAENKLVKQLELTGKKIAEMLATHTIDESLDFDFWMREDFSPDIFNKIFLAILGLTEEQVQKAQEVVEAQSFRQD